MVTWMARSGIYVGVSCALADVSSIARGADGSRRLRCCLRKRLAFPGVPDTVREFLMEDVMDSLAKQG